MARAEVFIHQEKPNSSNEMELALREAVKDTSGEAQARAIIRFTQDFNDHPRYLAIRRENLNRGEGFSLDMGVYDNDNSVCTLMHLQILE